MKPEATPQGIVAGSIPLFAGHPSRDLLPVDDLQRIVSAGWAGRGVGRYLNYGDEQGDSQLIDFLVERFNRSEALGISRENLMIIGGSTGGVGMITQQLTRPGDAVLVDAPSYRDALHIFRDHRLEICPVPIDDEGLSSATSRVCFGSWRRPAKRLASIMWCPIFRIHPASRCRGNGEGRSSN